MNKSRLFCVVCACVFTLIGTPTLPPRETAEGSTT